MFFFLFNFFFFCSLIGRAAVYIRKGAKDENDGSAARDKFLKAGREIPPRRNRKGRKFSFPFKGEKIEKEKKRPISPARLMDGWW